MTMTNQYEMPLDGSMMSGTWYNPKTGDKFTVRDMYFQNDEPMVVTTDGQQISYSIFQDYIQCTPDANGKITIPDGPAKPQKTNPVQTSPLDVPLGGNNGTQSMEEIVPDYGIAYPLDIKPATKVNKQSPNRAIIDKAMKHCTIPQVKFSFSWPTPPKKQLSALIDVMEVPVEEIIDYLCEEMFDTLADDVREQLATFIKKSSFVSKSDNDG